METFKARAKLLCLTCCVPAISFIIIRWPLFFLHKMIQWPAVVCVISLLAAAVFSCMGAAVPAKLAAAGFPLGFIVGQLFGRTGTDPGGGSTHNGWLVWLLVVLGSVLLGVLWFWAARKFSAAKAGRAKKG